MQLIPITSSPTLRIHFEAQICQLAPRRTEELKLRVKLPVEFKSNHLIMLLKLKQSNGMYVGPAFILCAKIINKEPHD